MPTPTSLDNECFFIAPIGADDSPERKRSDGVLDYIVAHAATELGLTAIRADKISQPGEITLQVIDHVLGAKAAVVDLTGLNANVFYELAVRHTARLPVALICDKSTKLPFDIAQMRTIFFDHTDLASANDCRQQIVQHLREAFEGAVDSPIATAIDVRTMQTGSPVERSLAEVVTTLDDLASMQRAVLSAMERDSDRGVHPGAVRDLLRAIDEIESAWMARGAGGEVDESDDALTHSLRLLRDVHNYLESKVMDTRPAHRPSAKNSRVAKQMVPNQPGIGRESTGPMIIT